MQTNESRPFSPEIETLWGDARRVGMSRRRFLALLALGGSSAVIAGLAGMQPVVAQTPTPTATPSAGPTEQAARMWVKDTGPFLELGTNLETLPGSYKGWITANDVFFVRNHVPTPRINAEDYRLRVEGDAVQEPLELTYEQLRNMPSHTVVSYLECAGNQRSLFEKVLGEPAEGGEWTYGGVGMASWTGVRLADILEMAGVTSAAVDVNVMGLDEGGAPEGGFNKPMSIEKAMNLDTILAYTMNGQDLPPDHGYPLRALVPGWVGSNSIKWVGSIMVSSEPVYVRNNTSSYVLVGPEWPPAQYEPAEGMPVYENNIKSFIALPWEATLPAGQHIIRGYAYSPVAPIANVEWSADEGQNWQQARITSPNLKYSWVVFEFAWDATAVQQSLMTRATDEAGNRQPLEIPFNEKGYSFNMVHAHPLTVS